MLEKTLLTMLGLWICLIILHVREDFEDASGSKWAAVLNMGRLFMQGLYRVLNMSEYGLTCLNNENTSGMNTPYIPQYAWPWLNIAGCPWDIRISPNKLFRHARVLNMPHLIYLTGFLKMPQKLNIPEFWICHDIVIITLLLQIMLFIILEFLFAPFVHPGAPQLTILSFFNTS